MKAFLGIPACSTWLLEQAHGGDIAFRDAFLNAFGIMLVVGTMLAAGASLIMAGFFALI